MKSRAQTYPSGEGGEAFEERKPFVSIVMPRIDSAVPLSHPLGIPSFLFPFPNPVKLGSILRLSIVRCDRRRLQPISSRLCGRRFRVDDRHSTVEPGAPRASEKALFRRVFPPRQLNLQEYPTIASPTYKKPLGGKNSPTVCAPLLHSESSYLTTGQKRWDGYLAGGGRNASGPQSAPQFLIA